jgi:ABC-type polysaccharide/polyol phosphate transport system ATPase subunit
MDMSTRKSATLDPALTFDVQYGARNDKQDIAVYVNDVTKHYKIYHNFITGPLKERLLFWRSESYFQKFRALRNVSLKVRRGEVVGIVGPNGSGKTTLLKSIAGLLSVDEGSIIVNGKVTALLAQGVGVHPEFSGRENIYFGGLMLGMQREEINRKIDQIIAFSELREYIDRPLRTYSSGMRARLLFSISMSVDPDILIIDEALAAGDAYFVHKCKRRIQEVCKSGATVIVVSHDTRQLEQLCDRAIFMVEGTVKAEGKPSDIVRYYNDWVFGRERREVASDQSSDLRMRSGSGEVVIQKISLLKRDGSSDSAFYSGELMKIRIEYSCAFKGVRRGNLFCGILLRPNLDFVGEVETLENFQRLTVDGKTKSLDMEGKGFIDLVLDPLCLLNNNYSLWVKIYTDEEEYTEFCDYHDVAPFFVARRWHSLSRGPHFLHPGQISLAHDKHS